MPEWLRVRDEHGNEFDLPPNHPLIKRKAAEVIKDYPENKGLTAVARAAKHRVDKAGKPTTTSADKTSGSPTGRDLGQPEKE